MRINKSNRISRASRIAATASLVLSFAIIGCGGSNAPTPALSQSQALAATADIFEALANAGAAGGFARHGVAEAEVAAIRNATPNSQVALPDAVVSSGIRPLTTPTTITITPYTFACPAGGNIVVSGSYTGTSTSQSVTVVEAINACADDGFVINGNPNVTVTDNSTEAGNLFTDIATITGGFTAGSSSCIVNVTVSATVNGTTYAETGSITGSICGVSVNSTL